MTRKPKTSDLMIERLVYDYLGIRYSTSNEQRVYIGYILPGESEELVKLVMDRWVSWKDRLLDQLEEHSPEYARLFGSRGIRYNEFNLLKRQDVGEELMERSRAFDYYYLLDRVAQVVFISTANDENKTDFQNYLSLLIPFLKAEIPILYSFFFTRKLPIYLPLKGGLDAHLYVPGRSGWGKSTMLNLLIFDLIRTSQQKKGKWWKRSVIVLEPNSDLVSTCLKFRHHVTNRERLVYLDPFINETCEKFFDSNHPLIEYLTKGQDYTFVINPFDLKDTSDKNVNYMVQELTEAFFLVIGEKPSPQMTAVLNTVLYVLLKKPGTTIADLMTFMLDDENEHLVTYGLSLPNPIHKTFLRTYIGNKKLMQTKSSIYYKMHSILSDDNFRRLMVGPSTVDLEHEINVKGAVVLINLSKGSMGASSAQAFGRLVISYIFGLVRKRNSLQPHQRKSSFMFIDEFQNFVTDTLNEIMAESRKLKLGVGLAQQVVGQNTPEETKKLIMGNTTLKVIGDLEPNSRKEICSQIPELSLKDFASLKSYSFFVHNAQKKEQGVLTLKTPSFLVNTKDTRFYMSDKELAETLYCLIHKSGYYIPLASPSNSQLPEKTSSADLMLSPQKTVFTPKFKKNRHEEE